MTHITKAVIPAAGLGTRFLPATKATPKEMLPVVDRPAIQYVVEEAAAAGLTDVLMVTGRNKRPLEDHFDRAYELEEALAAKHDEKRLQAVRAPSELAAMYYVRQGDPRGLGHAVLCGAQHVGDQPFAVQRRHGGSVVALIEVGFEQIGLYGCAAVEPTGEDDVVRVTGLVEKPPPAEAPSNLAIIGRYVLEPGIFDALRRTPPGRGGEIQLTDALATLAEGDGAGPVHAVVFRGRRYDTGDRGDYLRTIVRLACERDDLGPEFRDWLRTFVEKELDSL
jgi:UTP--glucose-1-phosphate uridylyltransferase